MTEFKIPAASDRLVLECFYEISKQFGIPSFTVNPIDPSPAIQVTYDEKERIEDNTSLSPLFTIDSILINRCTITAKNTSIVFNRKRESSIFYNSLSVSEGNYNATTPRLSQDEYFQLFNIIFKKLKAFQPGQLEELDPLENKQNLTTAHWAILERLERQATDVIDQGLKSQKENDEYLKTKSSELESNLKEHKRVIEEEYILKKQDLDKVKQDFDEKFKTIDDRNNTHVRREIRDKMLGDVTNRIKEFGVSEATASKRKSVHWLFLFLIIFFSIYSGVTFVELFKILSGEYLFKVDVTNAKNLLIITTSVRLILLSAGTIGSVIYYIKWEAAWASLHADLEFQLQQFHLDINRANWIIESCLEWKKETTTIIPTDLLNSITKNLFIGGGQVKNEQIKTPAEDFASALIKSYPRFKIKNGDSEIEVDGGKKPVN